MIKIDPPRGEEKSYKHILILNAVESLKHYWLIPTWGNASNKLFKDKLYISVLTAVGVGKYNFSMLNRIS